MIISGNFKVIIHRLFYHMPSSILSVAMMWIYMKNTSHLIESLQKNSFGLLVCIKKHFRVNIIVLNLKNVVDKVLNNRAFEIKIMRLDDITPGTPDIDPMLV